MGPCEAPEGTSTKVSSAKGHFCACPIKALRGKILHTRNRHLRNHRGFSVAFSNGLSVAFSNAISLFSGIFRRIITFPVDVPRICPMDFQWYSPVEFHVCDFRCVISCPEQRDLRSPAVFLCFCYFVYV